MPCVRGRGRTTSFILVLDIPIGLSQMGWNAQPAVTMSTFTTRPEVGHQSPWVRSLDMETRLIKMPHVALGDSLPRDSYCREIATLIRSSGSTMWSWLSSPMSIWTRLILPLNLLGPA